MYYYRVFSRDHRPQLNGPHVVTIDNLSTNTTDRLHCIKEPPLP